MLHTNEEVTLFPISNIINKFGLSIRLSCQSSLSVLWQCVSGKVRSKKGLTFQTLCPELKVTVKSAELPECLGKGRKGHEPKYVKWAVHREEMRSCCRWFNRTPPPHSKITKDSILVTFFQFQGVCDHTNVIQRPYKAESMFVGLIPPLDLRHLESLGLC